MYENTTANCSTVIVGKAVSETGRVIVAHNEDDNGNVAVRHRYVPAAEYAPGDTVPAEPGYARIPQVANTLGFYWIECLTDAGGLSTADAFMNDCGVVITSNSMSISKEDLHDPDVVKDGGLAFTLRRVLAERAHSAREGAEILMELISEWGYGPSGRAYTIADRNEAFMFQLVRGRHYVGARVPDDAVVMMPNHYSFHTLHDCPEMYYPDDIVEYAVRKGWYTPETEDRSDFDFAAAYQAETDMLHCQNDLRHKYGQSILLGREWNTEKEGMPFAVYPGHITAVEKLAEVMSAHYEGTSDNTDLYGPGDSPHCTEKVRRICAGTTLESDIWVLCDNVRETCVYTAPGRPCEIPYIPLHPLAGLPECLRETEDPLQALAEHLEPHPGICTAGNWVTDRFRQVCGAQEMVYRDTRKVVPPVLSSLLAAARQEDIQVKAGKEAAREDEFFLLQALERMEDLMNRFNLIPVCCTAGIDLSETDAVTEVEFDPGEVPEEGTLLFGVEYTDMREEYAKAVQGSLRKLPDGRYAAQFGLSPMRALLPSPGRYPFRLGGRTVSGTAFGGQTAADVTVPG